MKSNMKIFCSNCNEEFIENFPENLTYIPEITDNKGLEILNNNGWKQLGYFYDYGPVLFCKHCFENLNKSLEDFYFKIKKS